MSNDKILSEALETYGVDLQMIVLAEECSEVIQEVMKLKRGKKGHMGLIEEIADLDIMLDQFKLIWKDDINFIKSQKIKRLKERLDRDKKSGYEEAEKIKQDIAKLTSSPYPITLNLVDISTRSGKNES